MEIEYTVVNKDTQDIRIFTVRYSIIIDIKRKKANDKHYYKLDHNEFKFIGSTIDHYLQLLFIWGHNIEVIKIEIVGITDVLDVFYSIEQLFGNRLYTFKPERMWVKLLYPDGHFGFIEYDGSDEDRFRIIKEHTDLFGRNMELDLMKTTAGEMKKSIKKNSFMIDLNIVGIGS